MNSVARALSLLCGLALAGAAMSQTGLLTLEQLRDRSRPVLIFAPRPDDPRLEIQVRTLREHAAEAHDRELVAIALPYNNPSPTAAQLSPTEAEEARRRFHVAPGDFAVILLGKDGGSKLRSDKPLSMEKLSGTVDAMPMRKDEVRERSHGG
jgi:hypothetical protein